MMRLAELVGEKLKWVQPHATKMQFELLRGELVAATLNFRSSFGSFATAASADGTWTFKRVGFWQTRATIREYGAEADLAVFKNNTWSGGGTLELPDGRKYPADSNFCASKFEFKTESAEALIRYTKIGGMLHLSSEMEIQPLAKDVPETPWIAMLGWYLTVMMQADSAAVVAVIAAT